MPDRPEPELWSTVELCAADGRLNRAAVGWSRHPLHVCNLPESLARKKRWNYWCVTGETLLFSVTVVDLDVAQMAFAYYYDRATQAFAEHTVVVPAGSTPMPETPSGSIEFAHPAMSVSLLETASGGSRITVEAADFRGVPLQAEIEIDRPAGHETLNVVIPWSDELFQFTSKQNTLPARGTVTIGERHYEFAAPAYACLDYGRGVWPVETAWNWGAASGVQAGRLVGLNLGGAWTDGTGMTENALCIDGQLTKISADLRFDYDRSNFMTPWRITCEGGLVDLRFTPDYERVSKGGNESYFSEVHQVFGRYDGSVIAESGSVGVAGLFGWIEDHQARW